MEQRPYDLLGCPHPAVVAVAILLCLISDSMLKGQTTKVTGRRPYIKESVCLSCHREQTEHYDLTGHALTSQVATETAILGPLAPGHNLLKISDPQTATGQAGLSFVVGRDAGGFFQTSMRGQGGDLQEHRASIDEVIGAGVRGQTYLHWQGEFLYELPVSYWRDGERWINSPGFPDGSAEFFRPVTARCLECHATNIRAESANSDANRFDRRSLQHGIACTRCHGDAERHVAIERSPGRRSATVHRADSYVSNPAKFPRGRQVELCALCHGGILRELLPAFSYVPGEPLSTYFMKGGADGPGLPDVHGDQVDLLRRSRCYLNSPQMSCSTCHQVHAPEKAAASYSDRCLSCHKMSECGMFPKLGDKIREDCVDCHMPMQQSDRIVSRTAGETIHTSIRTHLIGIYETSQDWKP